MSQIIINDLFVSYHNKKNKTDNPVINHLSCQFLDGKFNVIIGPSGCGKTTLLRCIIGSIVYDGTITIDGIDIDNVKTKDRKLGYVSQSYSLYPMMTVFDNIAFPLKVKHMSKEEILKRVNEVADKLSLTECLSRAPRQLSGGQQQRVALARTIVNNPNTYLFDEPFSNIDPLLRSQERIMVKKVANSFDKTVIYVTHDFNEALTLGDYIFVMNNGQIVEQGSPKDIMNSTNDVVTSLKEATFGELDAIR